MTSPAKSAYMRVVELFKGRQASAADLKAAEVAFAATAEGASFLSSPGGPLENMSGSAVAEPPKKVEVVSVPNQVVVDAAAYAELVRLAGAAPALVVQARAALAAAPPVNSSAPGGGMWVHKDLLPEPSEESWNDFEYSIGIPGRTPPRRHDGVVSLTGPSSDFPPTEAALDAFVASLGLKKGGRR